MQRWSTRTNDGLCQLPPALVGLKIASCHLPWLVGLLVASASCLLPNLKTPKITLVYESEPISMHKVEGPSRNAPMSVSARSALLMQGLVQVTQSHFPTAIEPNEALGLDQGIEKKSATVPQQIVCHYESASSKDARREAVCTNSSSRSQFVRLLQFTKPSPEYHNCIDFCSLYHQQNMLEKQLNECLPMCAWQSAIKELRAQQSNGGRGEKNHARRVLDYRTRSIYVSQTPQVRD